MHMLWHFRLCPHSRAIRVAMAEAGFSFVAFKEERPWEWRSEFVAMNPAGELPVLQLLDGPIVSGAYAISEYVSEEMAAGPMVTINGLPPIELFPGQREGRAEVRRLVDWFLGKMHREVTRDLLVERIHGPLHHGPSYRSDETYLAAARGNLHQHLEYIGFLAYQRRWLAGDRMSYADMAAAAQLSCLDYLGEIAWDRYGTTKEWYARLKARPSVRSWLDERVPGLPPPMWYTDIDF